MEEVAETGLELEQGENRALIIEMAETRPRGLGLKPWILAAVSVLALVIAAVLWKGSESSPAQMNSPFIERLIAEQPALKERLGNINITEDRLMMERAGLSKNLTRLLLKDSLSLQHRKLSEKSVQESVATLREVLDASPDMANMNVAEMTKHDPALKTTTCIFHVLQAALYLAEAGSAINSAAVNCPEGKKNKENVAIIGRRRGEKASHVCAVEISAVLASFGWAAYFLSSAASTCGVDNKLADCAAQAIGLPTSFANIVESSIAMVEDCDNQDMKQMALSLKAKEKAKVQGDDGDQATAFCVLDPFQASYWLARAGLSIQNAVVDCATSKEGCAADVLFVIMSFGWAGGFLSSAVSDCEDLINLKALCSSDIIDLIAGISMAAGEAVEVDLNCVKTNPWPKKNLWTQTQ